MPMFQIIPTDSSSSVAAIIAADAAQVLRVVASLPSKEADVLRDGACRMTVRLGENGLWSIFQRDNPATAEHSIEAVG